MRKPISTAFAALVVLTLTTLGCAAFAGTSATLVVANQGDGTVSFVDLESFEVVETLELGNGPHEAAASPDNEIVYVSMYGRKESNDEIVVIDPSGREVIRRIDLAPSERPHGIATRGGDLYVTLEREGVVAKIDQSDRVVWRGRTLGELGHMLAVSPDGNRVYTGNMKTNDISILVVGRDEAVARVVVGEGPEGIALSPDGSELWVAHRMGGGLSVVDTSRAEVVANPGDGIVSARLTFTPDGSKVIAYDMASGNVIVFDRASRSEIGRYRPDEGIPVNGLAAPDSKTLYVIRYQPDAIFELDLETMTAGRTVTTGSMPDGMAIGR